MTITFTTETLRLLTLFENVTNVPVKDCFVDNGTVYFIVEEGKIGLAIGKGGTSIKKAEKVIGKKVKVFEYIPLLENETVNASETPGSTTGGWGEDWNFTVMVRDRFGRNVTIRLWHKSTDVAGYEDYSMVEEYNCTDCENWTQVNMSFEYNQSHMGNWYYFFNATNYEDGESGTAENTYKLEEDDVSVFVQYPVEFANISRNETTNFTMLLNDTDNRTAPPLNTKGKIWISAYSYDNIEGELIPGTTYWYTNGTGHLVRTMEPDETTDWDSVGWCSDKGKYYVRGIRLREKKSGQIPFIS